MQKCKSPRKFLSGQTKRYRPVSKYQQDRSKMGALKPTEAEKRKV